LPLVFIAEAEKETVMQKLIAFFFLGWTLNTHPTDRSFFDSARSGNARPGNFESMMNPLTLI